MEIFNAKVAKVFGVILIFAGCMAIVKVLDMDITVSTTLDAEKRVVNIQKMNDRSVFLTLSIVVLIVGVLTVGFAVLADKESRGFTQDLPPTTCPHCGAILKRYPANPAWCVQCRATILWREGRIVSAEETELILKGKLEQEKLEKEWVEKCILNDKLAWDKFKKERAKEFTRLWNALKKLSDVSLQIVLEIYQQLMRFASHIKSYWTLYCLTTQQANIRSRLGWKMYKNQIGDVSILNQIVDLTSRIESPNNNMIRTWFLKREYQKLIQQLAIHALNSDSIPSVFKDLYQEAKLCETTLLNANENHTISRSLLFPSDIKSRIRIGIGVIMLVIIFFVAIYYITPRFK